MSFKNAEKCGLIWAHVYCRIYIIFSYVLLHEAKLLSVSAISLQCPDYKAWAGYPMVFQIGCKLNDYRANRFLTLSVFLAYPEQLYSSHILSPLQKIHSTLFSCNSKSHVSNLEVTRANVASDVGSIISECFFTVGTYKQIKLTQWHNLFVKRDCGIAGAIILRDTLCHFNILRSFKWDIQSE